MFNESENLESIANILDYVPGNIIICINENNTINNLQLLINNNLLCLKIYCGDNWKIHQKK